MVRIICRELRREDEHEFESFVTVDIEAPSLEALLNRGGFGEGRYHYIQVIGAEIVDEQEALK